MQTSTKDRNQPMLIRCQAPSTQFRSTIHFLSIYRYRVCCEERYLPKCTCMYIPLSFRYLDYMQLFIISYFEIRTGSRNYVNFIEHISVYLLLYRYHHNVITLTLRVIAPIPNWAPCRVTGGGLVCNFYDVNKYNSLYDLQYIHQAERQSVSPIFMNCHSVAPPTPN